MRHTLVIVPILILLSAGCRPVLPPTAAPAPTASATPAAGPALPCETHTASVTLAAPAARVAAGDPVTVTVTLSNEGCVALGLPQYRLAVEPEGREPVLVPLRPEPIGHNLAIGPGQSDAAEFTLQAVAAGRATLTVSASFEVHLGYPGPAYWASAASSDGLVVVVGP